MNTLKKDNIQKQLFYLSKESVNYIVLKSKCGITMSVKELKAKNIPNLDINTIKPFSPLLCVYKKSSPKMVSEDNKVYWDEDTFRKKVTISSNAFMSLCLLELSDYFKTFKDIDSTKYNYYHIYNFIAKSQLEFYTSYLRNEEGVFVDKKDAANNVLEEIKFECKEKNFNFSDQAFLMAAFYKYSSDVSRNEHNAFYEFSMDILKMFLHFKDQLYNISYKELNKLCLALNIFYDYSKNKEGRLLLLDICEFLLETYKNNCMISSEEKVENECMTYLNFYLCSKNTGITKFMDEADLISRKLYDMYDPDSEMFITNIDKKEVTYTSTEIMLYLLVMLICSGDTENDYGSAAESVFKNMVIDSGLILSWPDAPNLNDRERYNNYSLNTEDMIDEINFRVPSMPLPESSELAPVFIKHIVFNRKKNIFTPGKTSFDSEKNFLIFFLIIYLRRL